MYDDSIISMVLTLNNIERGKGYFKVNNSLILQTEYQDKIRKSISEMAKKMQTLTHYGKSVNVAFVMNPLNMRLIRKKRKKMKRNGN